MSLPPPPPRKGDDNEWMTTYADIITLLLAFFVILFSMSTLKKEFFNQLTEEIVEGQRRGFAQKIQTLRPSNTPNKKPIVYRVFVPALEKDHYFKSVIAIEEENKAHKSRLTFPEESLFIPNTTKLTTKGKLVLKDTAEYLQQIDSKYFIISIECHHEKKSTPVGYKDKYRFSSERGLIIREELTKHGYEGENIKIIALGDSQPLKNSKLQSAHPNRRIDFVITRKHGTP